MTRMLGRIFTFVLLVSAPLASAPVVAMAQESVHEPLEATPAARVPFGVGERMDYDIRFGKLHVGSGSMEILPMDTVRGFDAWHTLFRLSGGIPFYHVNDTYEAWFDAHTLSSLRYWQNIDEGSYEPKRHYEIYPDRREYVLNDKPPNQSVAHPLDEASLLYYLRTVPLRVGLDTTINDYFQADRNPIHLKVIRKDTIEVPAGKFSAIVVQPRFESKLFSEGGHAEVWLSDDENHIMLQMKSKVSFGSLNLYLKSYRPSPTTHTPLNRLTPPPR
ncbi:MAG TPA: DUF3108 domain-containing protein [Gemmatimonadaceae bacterium]|jgi:hypothetical protein